MTAGRVFKWVGWVLAIGCLMLVLACLLVLFVNRNDEPPSSAVRRFEALARGLPPVADKDNGFIYFLGFSADPDVDPAKVGKQRLAWYRLKSTLPHHPMPMPHAKEYSFDSGRSPAIRDLMNACQEVHLGCARLLEANEPVVKSWLEKEQWLTRRYLSLLAFPQWRETPDRAPVTPELTFSPVLEGQKNHLLIAWLKAGAGDAASVRQLLEQDIGFWRRNLAAGDTLITKLVAAAAIRRHFAWANIILRRLPAGQVTRAIPVQWRVPLSDTERSMLRALAGEWRFSTASTKLLLDSTVADVPADSEAGKFEQLFVAGARPTFQQQATSNRQAQLLGAVADAVAVSYQKLPGAVRQLRIAERSASDWSLFDGGYNLLGSMLLYAGAPEWSKYAAPISDLEGIRRATLLVAEFRGQGVAAAGVREQLKASTVRDPYDGRSFAWSDEAQAIVSAGLVDGARGRTVIPY